MEHYNICIANFLQYFLYEINLIGNERATLTCAVVICPSISYLVLSHSLPYFQCNITISNIFILHLFDIARWKTMERGLNNFVFIVHFV